MTTLRVNLWWESRENSNADDCDRFERFVNGLPQYDSIYRSWLKSPKTRKEALPVPIDSAEAARVFAKSITRYDDGRIWPELGSNIWGGHAGALPYDFSRSSYADTSCSIGAYGKRSSSTPNHIFMRLSDLRPSTGRPWRASELRPLMKFARKVWSPSEMVALLSFGSAYLPEIPDPAWSAGRRPLKPWIGWITYLPPDLAARAKYPSDVEVEALDDGAALVTLCEEPFDKDDAEGMAKLRALEVALRPIQC